MKTSTNTATKTTDRALRAYQEAGNYLVLPGEAEGSYDVVKRDGTTYTVTGDTCECPDHVHRGGRKCKHLALVDLHRQQDEDERTSPFMDDLPDLAAEQDWQVFVELPRERPGDWTVLIALPSAAVKPAAPPAVFPGAGLSRAAHLAQMAKDFPLD